MDWSIGFHYNESLHQTPASQALAQLQEVGQDAMAKERSLILRLLA
jgi:hypothetical protein